MEKDFGSGKDGYPPKVKAMYEAVLELFASGRELSTLKVSEITKAAGIGKGTAYGYFSSKEEIIVGAIEYEGVRHLYMIMELIESGKSFRDIIFKGMDMMEKSNQRYQGFAFLEKVMKDDTIMGSGLWEVLERHRGNCGLVRGLTGRLLKMAAEHGQIQETDSYKVWGAILSQFVFYGFYLTHRKMFLEVGEDEAREMVYGNILKLLQ